MSNSVNATGVSFVKDNPKYPDYIRLHNVFKANTQIKKIFPSLGLPNVSEKITFDSSADTKNLAISLLYTDIRTNLAKACDVLASGEQAKYNFIYEIYTHISSFYESMISVVDKKIALNFKKDFFFKDEKIISNGESVFKGYTKIHELVKSWKPTYIYTTLENLSQFKNFSSSNIPSTDYQIVFSSTGEEGLWDIATISMRGIASCQSWNTTQSRGLIGSMSSRFVGVIYITSGGKFNEYGSKMIRRAIVRFCMHKETKKPALLVDKVYPAHDQAAVNVFRKFLADKTKLPVLFPQETGWEKYELIKDDPSRDAYFQAGDYTYMDTKIPFKPAKGNADLERLNEFCVKFRSELQLAKIKDKVLAKIDSIHAEYLKSSKINHVEEFSGGVSNFIHSLRVRGSILPQEIYPEPYSTPLNESLLGKDLYLYEDYKKYVLRYILTNLKTVTRDATINRVKALKMGFWSQYEISKIKYVNLVFSLLRKELIAWYKITNV